MQKSFADLMEKKTISESTQLTENGGVGYSTSGKTLLDMNFRISSYRNFPEEKIIEDFRLAFLENPELGMKFLFYMGDIRQGQGERRIFRTILSWLAKEYPLWIKPVMDLIPEYNRWDSMLVFLDTPLEKEAVELISRQLQEDLAHLAWDEHKPVSLLGKWLPSVNTSSKETREKAKKLCLLLGKEEREYRKILSSLRKRIGVVERNMTLGEWGKIAYDKVPSKANMIYSEAFLRHDQNRRQEYLSEVEEGKKKIISSVTFPHEIVHSLEYGKDVRTMENLWKALPNYLKNKEESILTVVDGSGSMGSSIGNTRISAHDVARGLGIYFSERLKGPFKDKYVTFSSRPRWVDFSGCRSLKDKLFLAKNYSECDNTDLYKVFRMVLDVAVENHLEQKDLPSKILVISDMEFDSCTNLNETIFSRIEREFKEAGYSLPGLVFWNVNSRSLTIPMQEGENGVALISGFSPTAVSMVLSGRLDPMEVLLEKLSSERYKEIGKRIQNL